MQGGFRTPGGVWVGEGARLLGSPGSVYSPPVSAGSNFRFGSLTPVFTSGMSVLVLVAQRKHYVQQNYF